jgi:hypothetical protein
LGCNHVFSIGQRIDQMGKVLKKMIKGQKKTQKGCMAFCHNPWSYVSKVVSIRWGKITWEEETSKVASTWQKKKRQFEGEVH